MTTGSGNRIVTAGAGQSSRVRAGMRWVRAHGSTIVAIALLLTCVVLAIAATRDMRAVPAMGGGL